MIKNDAREKIKLLKIKMKEPQYKKFGGSEGFMGMIFLLLSGAFLASAFSSLTLFPLLVAIVVASFAMLFILEGAAG